MNLKKLLFLFVILPVSLKTFSQVILMEEEVSKYDISKPTFGPNLSVYSHFFIEYAFIFDNQNENLIEIDHLNSKSVTIGYRYKFKLSNIFSFGTDLNYNYLSYHLIQNENKKIPNNIQHDNEMFKIHNLGTELYFRINFNRRGNVIGNFIDFAYYGYWSFSINHFYEDNVQDTNNPYHNKKIEVSNKDLDYTENIIHGARIRLGFGRIVFTATYRLSDFFKNDFKQTVANQELPRLTIGFQFGLHGK